MAQQFGKTWWGQQWLNSLNNIDYSNRLPRGSSYARNGAVTKLSINHNHIEAKVSGSRPKPYKVDIILPPFFDPGLSQFIDALAAKPIIISKLLNRELDPEVLSIAENQQLKVFPKQWTDFKMQCSCPDWAVPCKHLAAVIYKVSAEIDNNPFLVFQLHKIELIEELKKRGMFIKKDAITIPKLADLCLHNADSKSPKPKDFKPENAYQKLSFSTLAPLHEPLLSLLSPHPAFYPGHSDFKEKYAGSIQRVVKNGQKVLLGKTSLSQFIESQLQEEQVLNSHSRNKVTITEDFRAIVKVNDGSCSIDYFLSQLQQIPGHRLLDYQPSTAALQTLFHLALHLTANGAIVPQIVQHADLQYSIRWIPALLSKEVRILIEKAESILPPDVLWFQLKAKETQVTKDAVLNLLSVFITDLVRLFENVIAEDLFKKLFFRNILYGFKLPGEESLSGGIHAWIQKYHLSQGRFKVQILVDELPGDAFQIGVNIQDQSNPKENVPVSLKDVLTLKTYDEQRFEILQSTALISSFVMGLEDFINSKGEMEMKFENEVFAGFLFRMIPVLRLLDIEILLPKSLQQILKPKPSVKLKAKKGKTFIRLQDMLDFDWQIALGDTTVSPEEFRHLLTKSDRLIRFKTQYMYVSKEELEKLQRHFSEPHEISSFALLRAALSGNYAGNPVTITKEVENLIKELTDFQEIALPDGIKATLRPYQHRGFSWIYRNAKIGFGSVLADDMGLGKTLQVITTLLKYKEDGLLKDKKALVIAPTSLLTNWLAEIEKFAPTLKAHLFHGTSRKMGVDYDVLLTSYGIARTEVAKLKKLPWNTVIIDEAQNIKNNDTAQAKAIKNIGADSFIAMSGTPVENRLSELWSIMDYSNRGLLGDAKEFQNDFAIEIETYNDTHTAEKLKRITAPFMMRRLKTDKSIISDLPDKIEMDCFSTLVPEQSSLYEKTLEEALKEIEAIDATDKKGLFVRQGLVLQMILALKQICNHPTQFLKNNVLDASLSGKLELLFDKLDSIIESGEKVLVFTQFAEMGRLLQHFIGMRYKETPMFFHGGCTLKQRNEMVTAFQTNPADKIFILSLKAAGVGLNLTAAAHVIHYDLWWNPAVESQATDRAYRIGQKNNVMVHRFITKNTFEERINEMIQSKKQLANMTVATGEGWIGNLSNKELQEIFKR